jgi:hypothetical protein
MQPQVPTQRSTLKLKKFALSVRLPTLTPAPGRRSGRVGARREKLYPASGQPKRPSRALIPTLANDDQGDRRMAYSGLILAVRITLAHLSVCSAMYLP